MMMRWISVVAVQVFFASTVLTDFASAATSCQNNDDFHAWVEAFKIGEAENRSLSYALHVIPR